MSGGLGWVGLAATHSGGGVGYPIALQVPSAAPVLFFFLYSCFVSSSVFSSSSIIQIGSLMVEG